MVGQLQVPGQCIVIIICRSQVGSGCQSFCNEMARCPISEESEALATFYDKWRFPIIV